MLRLAWQTAEPDELKSRLAFLGFALRPGADGPIASVDGADVAIVERRPVADEGSLTLVDGSTRGGLGRSSEALPDAAPAAESGAVGARGLRLVALGWATVELERAAGEFAPVVFGPAAEDRALGARALLGRAAERSVAAELGEPFGPGLALVLLEPFTEGRLAARLARHGEGPAVLYVAGPEGLDVTAAAWRAAGIQVGSRASGPLGPSVLCLGLGRVGGPEVVAVEERGRVAGTRVHGSAHVDDRGRR